MTKRDKEKENECGTLIYSYANNAKSYQSVSRKTALVDRWLFIFN